MKIKAACRLGNESYTKNSKRPRSRPCQGTATADGLCAPCGKAKKKLGILILKAWFPYGRKHVVTVS